MYQALYRKWRPITFDDVVGQEHITVTLKKQVETDRLSHAYLFIGTRGTGKTTCAKILARAVNCEHPVNGNPCNECAACRGILDGSILDVVELDAASNNRVDDVRALQDEAIFSPASVKKRVYIIDEVHMLSTAAFNALLKILEEPPEHLLFILCTTELHKVLPTIVSRCQRHSFKRIEPEAIAQRLTHVAAAEHIDLAPEAAALLARMADGGMRDALSLLDQCSAQEHIDIEAVHTALGLAGSRRIADLLDTVCDHAPDRALTLFDELWKDGKDPAGILEELGDLLRDVLLVKVAPTGGEALLSGVYDRAAIGRFAAKLTGSDLMDAMAAIRAADLSGSNPRRAAEMCLVSLCLPETGDSLTALKSRVSRLEAALRGGASLPASVPAPTPEPAPAPAPRPEPEGNPEPTPADEDRPPWYTDDDAPPAENDFMPAPPPEAEPPVERPAPTPAPPPAPDPAPAPAPAASADDASELWTTLVRSLSGKLNMSLYAILNTPSQCSGELRGDVLTIYLTNPFSKMMLDTPANADIIRQELSAIVGRGVRVSFTDEPKGASAAPNTAKLDALGKFANVKFE